MVTVSCTFRSVIFNLGDDGRGGTPRTPEDELLPVVALEDESVVTIPEYFARSFARESSAD